MSLLALGIASLFFTGVSIAQQVKASQQAKELAEEQKKEQSASRRLAEIRNRRQRVEELRKERIARATLINAGYQTGVGKSSGVLGGSAAIRSQAASNIGFLNQTEETAQTIYASKGRQSDIYGSQQQNLAFASITGTLGQTFSPALKPMFKETT